MLATEKTAQALSNWSTAINISSDSQAADVSARLEASGAGTLTAEGVAVHYVDMSASGTANDDLGVEKSEVGAECSDESPERGGRSFSTSWNGRHGRRASGHPDYIAVLSLLVAVATPVLNR